MENKTDPVELVFPAPLADSSRYPAPKIKAVPEFKFTELMRVIKRPLYADTVFTKSGRSALGLAATNLKLSTKVNRVLLPAYHCPALVEPFVWAGYDVSFYPLTITLQPDFSQFSPWSDVTHCVLVDFFGLNCIKTEQVDWLNEKNITVIEDLAHALFAIHTCSALEHGVSAQICSINKVLPTLDGGLLKMAGAGRIKTQAPGLVDELKALAYCTGLTATINRWVKRPARPVCSEVAESESKVSYKYFNQEELSLAPFSMTRRVFHSTNFNDVIGLRRRNYQALFNALQKSSLGNPLLPLDQHAVPYVLPFLANNNEAFERLREAGIQVLRWEEATHTSCAVSEHFRRHLLQIPCHQDLSSADLDKIVEVLA